MTDIVERLKRDAILQMAWDGWELGNGPAPDPLWNCNTAKLEREAAAEIERLRAAVETGMVACEFIASWCYDEGKSTSAVLWMRKADAARALLPSPPIKEGGK